MHCILSRIGTAGYRRRPLRRTKTSTYFSRAGNQRNELAKNGIHYRGHLDETCTVIFYPIHTSCHEKTAQNNVIDHQAILRSCCMYSTEIRTPINIVIDLNGRASVRSLDMLSKDQTGIERHMEVDLERECHNPVIRRKTRITKRTRLFDRALTEINSPAWNQSRFVVDKEQDNGSKSDNACKSSTPFWYPIREGHIQYLIETAVEGGGT